MNLYLYEGPVMEFDKCIDRLWKATTYAVSERKARSNLTYRYKKQNNKVPYANISLPGKIDTVK